MKRVLVVALVATVASPAVTHAQLSVRQSFAAAAPQAKPASFFWTIEEQPADASFATIDAAARYSIDRAVTARSRMIVGPTVEWHKLTREGKEYDRVQLGASGELTLGAVTLPWLGSPVITGQLGWERNFEADSGGIAWSTAATLYSVARWAPGAQTPFWPGSMLRYYPYLGVERYPALPIPEGDVTVGFFQFNLEFWPYIGRIQLLGTYTAPTELEDAGLPDDLDRLSMSLNVFLDSAARFGIGVEYLNGAQPKDGFAQVKRAVLGFKAKI